MKLTDAIDPNTICVKGKLWLISQGCFTDTWILFDNWLAVRCKPLQRETMTTSTLDTNIRLEDVMSRAFWCVILLAFAAVHSSADSITPYVTPLPVVSPSLSTPLVHPGGTFSVSINIAGVTNLAGFQFSFSFNPSVVSATGISAGSMLSGGTFSVGTINNSAGTISLTAGSGGAVSGSGTVAVIFFTALGTGSSGLNLSDVGLLDANGRPINFSVSNGAITVTTVPEPATMSLFLLGAGPLVARRFRKRQTNQAV